VKEGTMTKPINDPINDTMRDEYDFSEAKQGEFHHLLGKSRCFKIHHEDGTVTRQPAPVLVALDSDVEVYFPTSEAVNDALRGLIALLPKHGNSSK
jgi:hypothetical protein